MLLRKVKVVSKNPIKIHGDYAEIVLLDRTVGEVKEVRTKAEEKYFKDFRYKLIEVN